MKKRRILAGTLAGAVLTAGLSFNGLAAVGDNSPTGDQHTTFGIMEAAQDPTNVQFEVPLYVTMAVVSGEAHVRTPQGYNITNTAATGGYNIGVTSMSIESIGTWTTVATAVTVDSATKIFLSIGGATMPATAVGAGRELVTLAGDFGTAAAPTAIAPQASLSTAANKSENATYRAGGMPGIFHNCFCDNSAWRQRENPAAGRSVSGDAGYSKL